MIKKGKLNSILRMVSALSAVFILSGSTAFAAVKNTPQSFPQHALIARVGLHCFGDTETGTDRFRVALYNPTDQPIQADHWGLIDNEGTIAAFSNSFVLEPHHRYGLTFFAQQALQYAGDHVNLVQNVDEASTTIDAVSWGTDTSAFDPSLQGVIRGTRMVRDPVGQDTNTASDWKIQQHVCETAGDATLKTPGSFSTVDEGIVSPN